MSRIAILTLLPLFLFGAMPLAMAEDRCLSAGDFAPAPDALPATVRAVAAKTLTIMSMGGAATAGAAARGGQYTYSARLEARLRDALPGVAVRVVARVLPPRARGDASLTIAEDLKEIRPSLVIWGPGGNAAARGEDSDSFIGMVEDTVRRIKADDRDLILMTLQYAPAIASVVNLYPYRMAVLRAADTAGVPVLDRYELMREWNGSGFLNLNATEPGETVQVARALYDCMGRMLAEGIVHALR